MRPAIKGAFGKNLQIRAFTTSSRGFSPPVAPIISYEPVTGNPSLLSYDHKGGLEFLGGAY